MGTSDCYWCASVYTLTCKLVKVTSAFDKLSHLSGNPAQCTVIHLYDDMCYHPSGSPHQRVLYQLTQISLNISQPPLMPVGVVSTWLKILWSKESGLRCIVGICIYMWQPQIEIEYYSVAYFECITEFNTL